jgi:hemoglobin
MPRCEHRRLERGTLRGAQIPALITPFQMLPETPYELLGGEARLRELVERFYDLMDAEPAFKGIRMLHQPDLGSARDKLFCFLSGWLDGPPLYAQKYGQPMLRARHLPFAIGVGERDQWMACMSRAMTETGVEPALKEGLERAFFRTADFMRNKEE